MKLLFDQLPAEHQTDAIKKALSEAFELGGSIYRVIERHYGGDEMGGGSGMGISNVVFKGTEEECEAFIEEQGNDLSYCPDGAKFYIRHK